MAGKESVLFNLLRRRYYVLLLDPLKSGQIGMKSTFNVVSGSRCLRVDLLSKGYPSILGEESGEAGPLSKKKKHLAVLGIRSWWKKPTDMELPLRKSDRPQGPWHVLLMGTRKETGARDMNCPLHQWGTHFDAPFEPLLRLRIVQPTGCKRLSSFRAEGDSTETRRH